MQSLKNWYIRSTDLADSQPQSLTVVPREGMASQGMTVDVVAAPVESKVQ
ncbi:hypothetical protein [Acaryochloris sp. IP29b_bin.148]|nr:hypothetical protein [Acaryochloris sp. IP29b_bin.148]